MAKPYFFTTSLPDSHRVDDRGHRIIWVSGQRLEDVSVRMSGTGFLLVALTYEKIADFIGDGFMEATGTAVEGRSADFDGTGFLDVTHIVTFGRSADFDGTGDLIITPSKNGSALLIGDSGLTVTLQQDFGGVANLDGTGELDISYSADIGSPEVVATGEFTGLATPTAGEAIPTSGLIMWYDPSIPSTLYEDTNTTTPIDGFDGDVIGSLFDISGNTNHVGATAGDPISTFVQFGINSLGTIQGTEEYTTSTTDLDNLDDMIVFMVHDLDDPSSKDIITITNSSEGDWFRLFENGFGAELLGNSDLAAETNDPSISTVICRDFSSGTSGELTLRVNASEEFSLTGLTGSSLGTNSNFSLDLEGPFAGEILVYNQNLTESEIIAVEEYLIDKWLPDLVVRVATLSGYGGLTVSTTFSDVGATNATVTLEGAGGMSVFANLDNETSGTLQGTGTLSVTTDLTTFNDPGDISGLVLWVDPSDTSTLDATFGGSIDEGDLISKMDDKSGQGNHMEAPAGKEPVYTTQPFLGPASLVFDFAEVMQHSSASGFYSDKFTIFAAVHRVGSTGNKGVLFVTYTGTKGNQSLYVFDSELRYEVVDDSFGIAQATTNLDIDPAWIIAEWKQSDEIAVESSDTALSATDTSDATPTSGQDVVSIGGLLNSKGDVAQGWRGYLGEIVVYNRDLTAGERNNVRVYMSSKWT